MFIEQNSLRGVLTTSSMTCRSDWWSFIYYEDLQLPKSFELTLLIPSLL